MRMSSDKDDPGYTTWVRGMAKRPAGAKSAVRVFLRDAYVEDVLTADEDEGMLVRCCRSASGDLILDGGEIRTEVLRGEVRIVYPAWWPKDCRA